MTKKSRYPVVLQVPRKLGLDIEKYQTLPRSKHRPTTADAESVWSIAREIVKAAARLSLYVLLLSFLFLVLDLTSSHVIESV